MAIQLNDRDQLIFKLIDEHQVLLEKHIAWFISGDDKPVLIRDRLRKLFYLDYLLCHRHGTKLPWWTTPTKPLVYMLSPMARTVAGCAEPEIDLFDAEIQRHLLEVANLRMLHLQGVKEGHIKDFTWKTCKKEDGIKLDAIVSFNAQGKLHKLGIINHAAKETLAADVEAALKSADIEGVLIVSRDEAHQQILQAAISGSSISKHCFFSTHHEVYKTGVVLSQWQGADQKCANLFNTCAPECTSTTTWSNAVLAIA
ncbi:MAG TPA: hypothetical protein V6C72_01810 [Chroococcales cyanobacterium]